MFPRYCDEQVRFEFKEPVMLGVRPTVEGSLYYQKSTKDRTLVLAYTGWLTDTIEFGTQNRRFSYCVYDPLKDSLQLHVFSDHFLTISDSAFDNGQLYFPVYLFNQGPDQLYDQYMATGLKYQIKTKLGWTNIDRFTENQIARCGNDYRHYGYLLPGEVNVYLFAKRGGPDRVESRICFHDNCSDIFMSEVNLKELLPISSITHSELKN